MGHVCVCVSAQSACTLKFNQLRCPAKGRGKERQLYDWGKVVKSVTTGVRRQRAADCEPLCREVLSAQLSFKFRGLELCYL